MRAVVFDGFGGPEVLRVAQVDEPHAGPGEVRVRVKTVGVNPLDWKIRSGWAPFPVVLPYVGGLEVAGIVDEIGVDVDAVSIGDEVFGLGQRGLAEHAVLTTFAVKPAELSWVLAAALPVAVETATRTLDQLGLVAGQTLLVNGAAGTVGSAAVQLAVAAGATVIGTARQPQQLRFLERLGCTPVLSGAGLVDRVRVVAANGIDVALDCAGQGSLGDLVALVGSPDGVITIADVSAAAHGVRFSAGGTTPNALDLARVAGMVAGAHFEVLIGGTFPFEQTSEAQRISQSGGSGGKLVIVVDDEPSGTSSRSA